MRPPDHCELFSQVWMPSGESVVASEWVGTSFNDKFYIVLNAPQTTGGVPMVINYASCANPSSANTFSASP